MNSRPVALSLAFAAGLVGLAALTSPSAGALDPAGPALSSDRVEARRLGTGITRGNFRLEKIGGFATGIFDGGGAEIAAYNAGAKRLFFVDADANVVQALDLSDPTAPSALFTVGFAPFGGGVNSVATWGDLAVAAVEADPKTAPGKAVFFDLSGHVLAAIEVGALPDMITFTPDGRRVVVANEGEPDTYCAPGLADDPEGTVSVIDVPADRAALAAATARHARFDGVHPELFPGLRIFGPGATPAQDIEPEYVAISDDSRTAYVTLQENDAIAVVDLGTATVTALFPLGTKDHRERLNQLDASDRDGGAHLANWPVEGMFQPDSIAFHLHDGRRYLVTANEGDAREYDCFTELARVKDLTLDPTAFPNAAALRQDANLGRLRVTTAGATPTATATPIASLRSARGRSRSGLRAASGSSTAPATSSASSAGSIRRTSTPTTPRTTRPTRAATTRDRSRKRSPSARSATASSRSSDSSARAASSSTTSPTRSP